MNSLSDKAICQVVAARQADRKYKQLRALTTAWEIEASDCQRDFLLTLQEDNIQQFNQSVDEATFFERMLERQSIKELEDNMDFTIAAYGHDLMSLSVADEHLNQLGVGISQ